VVARATNVLTVPNRAIKTLGRQKYVTVLDTAHNNAQVRVVINTGISDDTNTEVTSCVQTNNQCLQDGDLVVLNATTTSTTTGGGGGFIFGGGGGVRGPGR